MAANNRTLKELAASTLNQQPWCIEYPNIDVPFWIKIWTNIVVTYFRGLNKHLKEFHIVYSSITLIDVIEEQIKLRAFPFSSVDNAKDWLYYLPSKSIATRNKLQTLFSKKYFLASKTVNIWKEICGICHYNGEMLYEYWERFKKLFANCPHH